jgi:hypothetical protein
MPGQGQDLDYRSGDWKVDLATRQLRDGALVPAAPATGASVASPAASACRERVRRVPNIVTRRDVMAAIPSSNEEQSTAAQSSKANWSKANRSKDYVAAHSAGSVPAWPTFADLFVGPNIRDCNRSR